MSAAAADPTEQDEQRDERVKKYKRVTFNRDSDSTNKIPRHTVDCILTKIDRTLYDRAMGHYFTQHDSDDELQQTTTHKQDLLNTTAGEKNQIPEHTNSCIFTKISKTVYE